MPLQEPCTDTSHALPEAGADQAALRLQIARQRSHNSHQADRLQQQQNHIATLAARLRDSDARLAPLAAEVAALRAEVDALRGSTSWRITAPLRALIRAGRRLRGPRRG